MSEKVDGQKSFILGGGGGVQYTMDIPLDNDAPFLIKADSAFPPTSTILIL